MFNMIAQFVRDEEGATAIEYGLLAVLIAIAFSVGANLVGVNLNNLLTRVSTCLQNGGPCWDWVASGTAAAMPLATGKQD
jgi:pilus assembly protein Flp/PilA